VEDRERRDSDEGVVARVSGEPDLDELEDEDEEECIRTIQLILLKNEGEKDHHLYHFRMQQHVQRKSRNFNFLPIEYLYGASWHA